MLPCCKLATKTKPNVDGARRPVVTVREIVLTIEITSIIAVITYITLTI